MLKDNKTTKNSNKAETPIVNILVANGLSLEKWIENETKEITVTHWGAKVTFTPVICDAIIGDGLQLVYFGTMDQRPYHWLIRIDSKTDIESNDFDIETILEPLEECFGRHPTNLYDKEEFMDAKLKDMELQDYDDYEEYSSACEYPAIWYAGGHYGLVVNMVTGKVG